MRKFIYYLFVFLCSHSYLIMSSQRDFVRSGKAVDVCDVDNIKAYPHIQSDEFELIAKIHAALQRGEEFPAYSGLDKLTENDVRGSEIFDLPSLLTMISCERGWRIRNADNENPFPRTGRRR